MLFAIALDVGLVDPHQGSDFGQLVRGKRVRKPGKMLGQHEGKVGGMAAFPGRDIYQEHGDVYR
jgi:hypothetical protein